MKNSRAIFVFSVILLTAALLVGCAGVPSQPVYDPVGENISFVLDPLGHIIFRNKLYCQEPDCSDKYPRGYCPPGQVCPPGPPPGYYTN